MVDVHDLLHKGHSCSHARHHAKWLDFYHLHRCHHYRFRRAPSRFVPLFCVFRIDYAMHLFVLFCVLPVWNLKLRLLSTSAPT